MYLALSLSFSARFSDVLALNEIIINNYNK
jgi:hypothetical protein